MGASNSETKMFIAGRKKGREDVFLPAFVAALFCAVFVQFLPLDDSMKIYIALAVMLGVIAFMATTAETPDSVDENNSDD